MGGETFKPFILIDGHCRALILLDLDMASKPLLGRISDAFCMTEDL
jgi:hypothetical protein